MEAEVKIKKKDGSTKTVKYGPQERYQKENIQRIVLKLNKKTDAAILDWLNSLDNKQGAIKEALRMRIASLAIQRRCNIPAEEVIPQLKPSVPVMLMEDNFSNCGNKHDEMEAELVQKEIFLFKVKFKCIGKEEYYSAEFRVMAKTSGKAQTLLEEWLANPKEMLWKYETWVSIKLVETERIIMME